MQAPNASVHGLLHTGWQLREIDPALSDADHLATQEGWLPASVPGTVYQDLIAQGRIPDPFLGCNEANVQWVAERDWLYRLDFDFNDADRRETMTLAFEGLDTFAQVWLNGERVLVSDNMFVPARVDVTQRLRTGANTLCLRFDSALRRGRELEAQHGRRPLWNGDASRLYVRKAPYHYGWDWGPTLLTAGPWQPIRLEAHDLRLAEMDSPVWLSDDLGQARIDVHTRMEGSFAGARLRLRLRDPDGQLVAESSTAAAAHQTTSLAVPAPRLWWPAGHGDQPLYTLSCEVLAPDSDQILSHQARRLGLRRLRLLQGPVAGEAGRSFHFEVNGREIFAGGANWIPDDNLLNRITPARYRERVAQMTMLRVWGGGIYESDDFYDACDELGVLVWQDFLFACGLYPAYPAYLASVEAEARAAITRLRHRASLAIWCGNNEDYMLAESVGAYGPGKDLARFDARTIYEDRLPSLCSQLDPGRPYWPGSPYTSTTEGLLPSQDPSIGDRHSWEVWHQLMLPYAQYAKVGARFVSEFGMQSHPSLALLEASIPAAEQFPGSRTMQWHNKAFSPAVGADGHRRLAVYAADTLRAPNTLAGEVYATQFVQAEAMRHAFEAFRRGWREPGARACGGALVWQLNDCWPVTSWALIDSSGRPKPAWFATRRALAPVACALRRATGTDADAAPWTAWAVSSLPSEQAVLAHWQLHALDGAPLADHAHALTLRANGSTELRPPSGWAQAASSGAALVATLTLRDATAPEGQTPLACAHDWPAPFRWFRLPDPGLTLQCEDGGRLRLHATRPAKGVWLDAPHAVLSDNFLDLLPGQTVFLDSDGRLDTLAIRCLNTVQDPAA
jgi:beta-mannosidase